MRRILIFKMVGGLSVYALSSLINLISGPSCYCNDAHKPICASDGQTFSSLCDLMCYNVKHSYSELKMVHYGVCNEPFQNLQGAASCFSFCPDKSTSVCGSDGKTYGSRCALDCVKRLKENGDDFAMAHYGDCQAGDASPLPNVRS